MQEEKTVLPRETLTLATKRNSIRNSNPLYVHAFLPRKSAHSCVILQNLGCGERLRAQKTVFKLDQCSIICMDDRFIQKTRKNPRIKGKSRNQGINGTGELIAT